jgi:hypothetical protein
MWSRPRLVKPRAAEASPRQGGADRARGSRPPSPHGSRLRSPAPREAGAAPPDRVSSATRIRSARARRRRLCPAWPPSRRHGPRSGAGTRRRRSCPLFRSPPPSPAAAVRKRQPPCAPAHCRGSSARNTGTSSIRKSPSIRAATMATAPRDLACAANRAPSVFTPASAKNRFPGSTTRLSAVSPVTGSSRYRRSAKR